MEVRTFPDSAFGLRSFVATGYALAFYSIFALTLQPSENLTGWFDIPHIADDAWDKLIAHLASLRGMKMRRYNNGLQARDKRFISLETIE